MTIHFGDGTTLETAPEGGGGQLVGVKGVRNTSTLTSTSTGYQIPSGQTKLLLFLRLEIICYFIVLIIHFRGQVTKLIQTTRVEL